MRGHYLPLAWNCEVVQRGSQAIRVILEAEAGDHEAP